jgi:iron complex transport system permease protein
MNKKNILWFSFLMLLCIGFFMADILSGSVAIPFSSVINTLFDHQSDDTWRNILMDYRLPKAITAALAGAGLAVCGLQLQTLFRNPLAGPDVLGITSGASLGVALSIMVSGAEVLSMGGFNTQFSAVFAAEMGAIILLLVIILVSFRIRDHITILILGLMLGQLSAALQGLLQYFSRASEIQGFVLWGMGNFGNVSGNGLWILFLSVLSGMLISTFSSKYLNVLLLGEKYALSMGLNLKLLRILIILSTGIITGTITAYCGPIAFIGIAVPHITKGLFKITDHLILIPAVALSGAALALFCDVIAHLPFFGTALPVNIITSVIGAPIVIWVIIRQRNIRHKA